jgi:hypothetical protein
MFGYAIPICSRQRLPVQRSEETSTVGKSAGAVAASAAKITGGLRSELIAQTTRRRLLEPL